MPVSEETGIPVCSKDHVTRVVCNTLVRVCGDIVKELVNCMCHGSSSHSLLGAEGSESGKEFIVYGLGIVDSRGGIQ